MLTIPTMNTKQPITAGSCLQHKNRYYRCYGMFIPLDIPALVVAHILKETRWTRSQKSQDQMSTRTGSGQLQPIATGLIHRMTNHYPQPRFKTAERFPGGQVAAHLVVHQREPVGHPENELATRLEHRHGRTVLLVTTGPWISTDTLIKQSLTINQVST